MNCTTKATSSLFQARLLPTNAYDGIARLTDDRKSLPVLAIDVPAGSGIPRSTDRARLVLGRTRNSLCFQWGRRQMILVAPTVTTINEAISAWNTSAVALVGLHFEDGITSIFEVPLEVQIPELEVGPIEPIDALRVNAESVIQGIFGLVRVEVCTL